MQKNERLTHLFMRIFLLVLFPDLHAVVIFFIALEFMCRVLFIYFLWALKFLVNSPSPQTFVTHDETNQANATNQAINKLEQIEQCVSYETNESMCSKLDRSYNI